MSTVFLCKHLTTQRLVAVKVLQKGLAESELSRFKNEANALSSVAHPNIVQIFAFGLTQDKSPFIEMEFLEGTNLEQRLKDGPLSKHQFLQVFEQILSALSCLHSSGLVHRDIKPSNIMYCDTEGNLKCKLLDFGIAKRLGNEQSLTRSGTITGTPNYMSPEQWRGEPVDARSDLYSLGCIMYECATGVLPFEVPLVDGAREASFKKIPFIPEPIEALVSKLLQFQPDARFDSANEALSELRNLDLHATEPFRQSSKLRNTKPVLIALCVGVLLITVAVMTLRPHAVGVVTQDLPFDVNSRIPWLMRQGKLDQARQLLVKHFEAGNRINDSTQQTVADLYLDAMRRGMKKDALTLANGAFISSPKALWLDCAKRKLEAESACGIFSEDSLNIVERMLAIQTTEDPQSSQGDLKVMRVGIAMTLNSPKTIEFFEEACAAEKRELKPDDGRIWLISERVFKWVQNDGNASLVERILNETISQLCHYLESSADPDWSEQVVPFLYTYCASESSKAATKLNERLSKLLDKNSSFAPQKNRFDLKFLAARIGSRLDRNKSYLALKTLRASKFYSPASIEKKVALEQVLAELAKDVDLRTMHARAAYRLAQTRGVDAKTRLSAQWTLADILASEALSKESIELYESSLATAKLRYAEAKDVRERDFYRDILFSITRMFAVRCIDSGDPVRARSQFSQLKPHSKNDLAQAEELVSLIRAKEAELNKR